MIQDELKQKEPIAYRSLGNCLKNNKVAHSYLFSGEFSPLKIDAAYLLAMSIIEDKNDYACETCDTCVRIRNNEYFDVIYIDGYKQTIKKDDIDRIMDEFSRTSLEANGKKVYILANINNSSTKVLNMILKFMEEPSNDNTFGIFITDKKEDLLPTVVSRCEEIPFLQRDFSYLINEYIANGFDSTDAYLLTHIFHEYKNDFDLNDPYYLQAKDYVYKTIESLNDTSYIPVLFSRELYVSFKDRDELRTLTDYYLDIMIKMIEDALVNKMIDDEDYNNHLATLRKYKLAKLFEIMSDAKDKILVNAERKLLFDSIAYQIISYI